MAEQHYQNKKIETWSELNILAVDGVVWRTTDTPENNQTFKAQNNVIVKISSPKSVWFTIWK